MFHESRLRDDSFEIHWHESVGTRARAALAVAAATTVTGSGRMHLQVTTLNETSAQTLTTDDSCQAARDNKFGRRA